MTAREITIIRALLEVLRLAEPVLLSEVVLHGNVTTRLENEGAPRVTLDEFEACLRLADGARLISSDRNRITQALRWTISAEGRVALKEMK